MRHDTLVDPRYPKAARTLRRAEGLENLSDKDIELWLRSWVLGWFVVITTAATIVWGFDAFFLALGVGLVGGLVAGVLTGAGALFGTMLLVGRSYRKHEQLGRYLDVSEELRDRWKTTVRLLTAGLDGAHKDPRLKLREHFDLLRELQPMTDALKEADQADELRIWRGIVRRIEQHLTPVVETIRAERQAELEAAELKLQAHRDMVDLLLGPEDQPEPTH